MEDQIKLPNPDQIREALAVQDENLQLLRKLVASINDENIRELQNKLSDRLRLLEEMEQKIWSTLFPKSSSGFPAEHRMTMVRTVYKEQYY